MITVWEVDFSAEPVLAVDVDISIPYDMGLEIVGQTELEAAPTSIVVTLSDGIPETDVNFFIDGIEVFTAETNLSGAIELLSVPIPDLNDAGGNPLMTAGDHVLSVSQEGAGVYDSTTFTLRLNPPARPQILVADAPPVDVPAATLPDGHRRWVLQDLQPGGLGSWVMPMSPQSWDGPPFERDLTVQATTASADFGGQFHIFENAKMPVERTFEGYCPTEEMRAQLEAYGDLRRRFYLIDHRGRAWIVTFSMVEMKPRLMQIWNGDWTAQGHDYKVTAVCYSRSAVQF